MNAPAIRVLVVDDSAVAREVLTTVLRSEGFDVTATSNAGVASQRLAQQRPDVLLLDLQMPGMSGLDFLEQLMRVDPLPVVVCSDIARPGAAAAIRALELGALDVIPKPTLGIRALLEGAGAHLGDVVRAAAGARTRRPAPASPRITPRPPTVAPRVGVPAAASIAAPWQGRVILLGASTGGTEALREVLAGLAPTSPPVVIVQHMPAEYTGAFARRLNEISPLQVREAVSGDVLEPGVALVAPGGRQLELLRVGSTTKVSVHDGPPVSGHRPSVDALFHSAARVLGARAIAALLTGMGADGAAGMLALSRSGAETIAQDEASCVVFGMPKEAIALGAVQQILPLDAVAKALTTASAAFPRARDGRGPTALSARNR